MHLVGPYYANISWCTVHRMSNPKIHKTCSIVPKMKVTVCDATRCHKLKLGKCPTLVTFKLVIPLC